MPLPGQRPASVTVLAIIGIIFASFGTIGACLGVIGLVGSGFNRDPLNMALMNDPLYMTYQIIAMILGLCMTVLLWFGSIGSLQLKPFARKTMLTYAWCELVILVFNAIFMYGFVVPFILDKALATIPAGAGAPPAAMMSTMKTMFLVMIPFVVIFGSAFPVCVLIFFTRKKVVNAFNGIFENWVPPSGGFPMTIPPGAPTYPPQNYPPQGPSY